MATAADRDDAAGPVESPCTRVCTLDPAGSLCIGCGRTPDEIAAWTAMTAGQRAAIMARLPERLARRAGALRDSAAPDRP